jgi:RNA polymerase sigma-70 factor (ECF subfamily)
VEISELTKLVHLHESELLRFAAAILKDAALAQDAVQGAFNALTKRFIAPRNPRAWLYRATKNRALNILRCREKLHFPGELPELCSEEDSPEREMFIADRETLLRRAVDELPPGQRAVLVLRFYENMSYGEIAEYTGSAPGTVASQLHDALQKLSALVKDGKFREEIL